MKRAFIRGVWGIYDNSNRLLARRSKIDNDIDRILKNKFNGIYYIPYQPQGFNSRTNFSKSFIAFYPNQIKLADGTNSIFDSNNPDIRYSKGGELAKGIKAEKEHLETAKKLYQNKITPEQSAVEIAKDHLKENDKYYSHLQEMERKFGLGGQTPSQQEKIAARAWP
jgi:transposase